MLSNVYKQLLLHYKNKSRSAQTPHMTQVTQANATGMSTASQLPPISHTGPRYLGEGQSPAEATHTLSLSRLHQ